MHCYKKFKVILTLYCSIGYYIFLLLLLQKVRVKEFHDTIIRYVESLLHTQQEVSIIYRYSNGYDVYRI